MEEGNSCLIPHHSTHMDQSASSLQLQQNLQNSIHRAFLTRRPILTHLNADTTWLLQLPYPHGIKSREGRSRYNIVFDPWLQGPQSDVASWFSKQWHATDSSVQSIGELQCILKDIDDIEHSLESKASVREPSLTDRSISRSFVDAVVVSHEFTDHCNKATLLEFQPEIPVFATKLAADLIISWNYFTTVLQIPSFTAQGSDWRKSSIAPLPSWIGISKLVTETDALYYHSAILITFDITLHARNESRLDSAEGEAVLYTPHGIQPDDVRPLYLAKPPISTLALLHGLHDITINPLKQLNLGAHNGLKAQRICKSKYWISTHDEVKKGSGLVAAFLRRKVISLQEAMEQERKQKGDTNGDSTYGDIESVTFADISNGESILLL